MQIKNIFRRSLMLCALLSLAGCASVNDLGMYLVESSASGYLLVHGQMLEGKVYLTPGRSGRVAFNDGEGTVTACNGTLRYTGTNSGEIDLRCNDGTAAVLKFTLLSETRGFAYGSSDGMPVNLAFGLSKPAAMAYLMPAPAAAPTDAAAHALETK